MTISRDPVLLVLTGALVAGTVLAGCALEREGRATDPTSVEQAPAGGEPTAEQRSYDWSIHPSPLVLALPAGDITLQPWTTCWSGPSSSVCRDGAPAAPADLERVDADGPVQFWFGRPGWAFSAEFVRVVPDRATMELGEPTASGVVADLDAQNFTLTAPNLDPGDYRVDVFGRGPEGDYATSFVWAV